SCVCAARRVVRVRDYGKWRYEEERKSRQSRRNQVHVSFKEVRLRPKIGVHDYEWKRSQALGFLKDGAKVKAIVFFRGREREHPERARELIDRLAADVGEVGKLEGTAVFESRTMTAGVAPLCTADTSATCVRCSVRTSTSSGRETNISRPSTP